LTRAFAVLISITVGDDVDEASNGGTTMIDRETVHAEQFGKLGDAAGPSWAALTCKARAALWRQYQADALADDAADAHRRAVDDRVQGWKLVILGPAGSEAPGGLSR
jgi:hypothetical protein